MSNGNPKPFVQNISLRSNEYIELFDLSRNLKLRSGYVTLAPGKEVGTHSTKGYEEMIVFLEGEGEVVAGKDCKNEVKKGSIAYNPPNTEHNVINTGSEDLKYIYIVTPVEF